MFALHGVDDAGRAVLVRPNVARAKLLELVAALPPCLIGRDAQLSGACMGSGVPVSAGGMKRPLFMRFNVGAERRAVMQLD